MFKIVLFLFLVFGVSYADKINDLENSCDNGKAKACRDLAYMYEEGRGKVYKNKYKAIKFYKEACDKNDATACNRLGVIYRDGINVKKSYFKAKKYFDKACDLGNDMGCIWERKLQKDKIKDILDGK